MRYTYGFFLLFFCFSSTIICQNEEENASSGLHHLGPSMMRDLRHLFNDTSVHSPARGRIAEKPTDGGDFHRAGRRLRARGTISLSTEGLLGKRGKWSLNGLFSIDKAGQRWSLKQSTTTQLGGMRFENTLVYRDGAGGNQLRGKAKAWGTLFDMNLEGSLKYRLGKSPTAEKAVVKIEKRLRNGTRVTACYVRGLGANQTNDLTVSLTRGLGRVVIGTRLELDDKLEVKLSLSLKF